MKIYTKKGDKGKTSIIGGERVDKDDLRVESYGNVDELNSVLGLLTSMTDVHKDKLQLIQSTLFEIGSELASVEYRKVVRTEDIEELEKWIDEMSLELIPLRSFILPGGSQASSVAHIARTVARRTERSVVRLMKTTEIPEEIVAYVNRLSDYLFVLARYINQSQGVPDVEWKSKS